MNAQERRGYIALMLGFLVMLATSAASYFSLRDFVVRSSLVDHTHEVRRQLALLLSAHQELLSMDRGYAITGDRRLLEPFRSAIESAERARLDLAAVVQDNPKQTARVQTLEQFHRQRIARTQQVIEARQRNGSAAAMALISSGEGGRMMDALHAAVIEMDAEEALLLTRRAEQERQSVARLQWALLASTLFAVFLLASAAVLMHRELRRRQRAEQTVLEQNTLLEDRVRERTRDLLAANTELERFNSSMVDRELRMIRLKGEVNELLTQLGQPRRYPLEFEKELP